MRLEPVIEVATPAMPEGYALRTFRPGDEAAWIALLNTGFDPWDEERLRRVLAREQPRLPLEGIFFITRDNRMAGGACLFLHQIDGRTIGELGWVVVDPAHQGHRLGLLACRAALGFAFQQGARSVYLRTEDSRAAAIRTYLRLGFEPELRDATHPERWCALLA